MFAKSTLASAIAAALGVSAVGIQTVQAEDGLFFPYFAIGADTTTIVSVINTGTGTALYDNSGTPLTPNATSGNLHYRVFYKSADPADYPGKNPADEERLAACEEINVFLPTSRFDIQSFDLGGHFGADTLGVVYNDPSINNKWSQAGKNFDLLNGFSPVRGYLFVSNDDSTGAYYANGNPITAPAFNHTLSGESFLFDFTNGAAWGYQALSNDGNNPANLIAGNGRDFSQRGSQQVTKIAVSPTNEFHTAFFVTPVSMNQAPDGPNDYRARVEITTSEPFTGRLANDFYDRDENLWSGTVAKDVVCVGRVNLKDLVSEASYPKLVNGGWIGMRNYRLQLVDGNWAPADISNPFRVANTPVNVGRMASNEGDWLPVTVDQNSLSRFKLDRNGAPILDANGNKIAVDRGNAESGALVIKLEYNANGKLNGQDVGGTFNNGYILGQ